MYPRYIKGINYSYVFYIYIYINSKNHDNVIQDAHNITERYIFLQYTITRNPISMSLPQVHIVKLNTRRSKLSIHKTVCNIICERKLLITEAQYCIHKSSQIRVLMYVIE